MQTQIDSANIACYAARTRGCGPSVAIVQLPLAQCQAVRVRILRSNFQNLKNLAGLGIKLSHEAITGDYHP